MNEKRVIIKVSSGMRRIVIAPINVKGEIDESYYNYEFYLRHTIDSLIIDATKYILKILDLEYAYKLWD